MLAVSVGGCDRGERVDAADLRGRVLPEPRPKIDFTLTDTDGQPFGFAAKTEGYVALLFFGYTNCPDVCPVHMANLGAVLADFPFELRQQFKVVFVTTDPERDTPERLREWLDNFDREFIGLWGTHERVNEIETTLGLPASVKPADHGMDYEVGHAASVVAFTKDNLAHVMYPFGTRQSDWAHDLPKLAKRK
jgi:protein SCO1/2